MRRIASVVVRILRAIGREGAATIRFGAIPAAAAPRGTPAQSDVTAAVAGMTTLGQRDDDETRPS